VYLACAEAGLESNLFKQVKLDDDEVFSDYAKPCPYVQSVPLRLDSMAGWENFNSVFGNGCPPNSPISG
jgi:hypothetical protein